MKIRLFVDDIRREPEGWVRARTVTEAIRLLATQDVEEVEAPTVQAAIRDLKKVYGDCSITFHSNVSDKRWAEMKKEREDYYGGRTPEDILK